MLGKDTHCTEQGRSPNAQGLVKEDIYKEASTAFFSFLFVIDQAPSVKELGKRINENS